MQLRIAQWQALLMMHCRINCLSRQLRERGYSYVQNLQRLTSPGVGFTLAHQYLDQLPVGMRSAVLGNARSRVCFHLPPADAVVMAKGHPELTPDDFTALGTFQVYASLQDNTLTQQRGDRYVSGRTQPLPPATASPEQLRRLSRERYGRPLGDIEAELADLAGSARAARDEPTTGRRANPHAPTGGTR